MEIFIQSLQTSLQVVRTSKHLRTKSKRNIDEAPLVCWRFTNIIPLIIYNNFLITEELNIPTLEVQAGLDL